MQRCRMLKSYDKAAEKGAEEIHLAEHLERILADLGARSPTIPNSPLFEQDGNRRISIPAHSRAEKDGVMYEQVGDKELKRKGINQTREREERASAESSVRAGDYFLCCSCCAAPSRSNTSPKATNKSASLLAINELVLFAFSLPDPSAPRK